MTNIRLHFDPHQPHQAEAIEAVVELFRGQVRSEQKAGTAQGLRLDEARVLANVQEIQSRHGLAISETLGRLHFSVEMETGTGKTYAYLRTLRELHLRYGYSRFILVVPSVAIREGVIQQITATSEHFAALYTGSQADVPVSARTYRPHSPSILRRFSTDPGIQILVINIDAFNKGKGNLIHRPSDAFGGRSGMDLLSEVRPIVVMDEPQKMEGAAATQAIASLHPLFVLRYSATHRKVEHLMYRLDPVRAYDLGLVKRIEVASVVLAHDGAPPLEVRRIQSSSRGVSAKVAVDVLEKGSPSRRQVTLRQPGDDLYELTGNREIYRGWVVEEIDAEKGVLVFENGSVMVEGQESGWEARFQVMRQQIEETIREHFEKEARFARLFAEGPRIKVLSLFFIDRVAHYVGQPGVPGPIQRVFIEAYERLLAEPRYTDLGLPPVHKVKAAYFARKRGEAIDTGGASKEDGEAYHLIMRHKERLLSPDEPVRFIFSHSALREGWDNPNVFQICTLHPTRSEMRKRQEIGRGLRLPVLENGHRLKDLDLARLTVVANQHYEDFARRLQSEIHQDFGVDFEHRISDRRARELVSLRSGWKQDPWFQKLWTCIARPTRMVVDFDSESLKTEALLLLSPAATTKTPQIEVRRAQLALGLDGIRATQSGFGFSEVAVSAAPPAALTGPVHPCPNDPLRYLQRETGLTRRTLAAIVLESGRLTDWLANPGHFLEEVSVAVKLALSNVMAKNVRYEVLGPEPRSAAPFEDRPLLAIGGAGIIADARSIYAALPVRSQGERQWLEGLAEDDSLKLLIPWPSWLAIDTPLGALRPSWAVLRQELDGVPKVEVIRPHHGRWDPLLEHCLGAFCEALDLETGFSSDLTR
jgi:type III restriction enzyme